MNRTVPLLAIILLLMLIGPVFALAAQPADAGQADAAQADAGRVIATAPSGLIQAELPWWGWALLLFAFTVLLGLVAVIGGIGGGVLFVPIVSALFPFHFDFVRSAGLMVALCGAIAAGPRLLRGGIASMRLGLPMALLGSIGSIVGAFLGLALPTGVVEGLLGIPILAVVALMLLSKRSEFPDIQSPDPLSATLGISGAFFDRSVGRTVSWQVHNTPVALLSFVFIGLLAGMFGLGAGWANVPALNLLLGAPIKAAVATSGFIVMLNNTAAAWIYINGGALLPLVAVPSVIGMMIGTRIGAQILPRVHARFIRWLVIVMLAIAGIRSVIVGIQELIS